MGRLKDTVPMVVAAWVAVSVPVALLVGRMLRGRSVPPPASTRDVAADGPTTSVA